MTSNLFSRCKNSKTQGDIGLAFAIAYFTSQGWTTSVPLTDSQDYDLVVDIENSLKRVQVKTASYKNNNNYAISLTIKGGNKSCSTIKKFNKENIEYIFILTSEGTQYFIPTVELTITSTITLNKNYDKFLCKTCTLEPSLVQF